MAHQAPEQDSSSKKQGDIYFEPRDIRRKRLSDAVIIGY
jgi:hypothetical protein